MTSTIQYRDIRNRVITTVGALFAWSAVILQFVLTLQNSTISTLETIIQFFSYYTILTNTLVALCFTTLTIKHPSDKHLFFSNPSVLAATAVYIIVVGGIYNVILRGLWSPTGLQFYVDELLHTIIPLFYVAFWMVIARKSRFTWNKVFVWLVYPLGYFLIILIRGASSGFYPYPFVNVTELGYLQVLINSVFITSAFILLSLFIILISRMISSG